MAATLPGREFSALIEIVSPSAIIDLHRFCLIAEIEILFFVHI
jgi:hypothetical protein